MKRRIAQWLTNRIDQLYERTGWGWLGDVGNRLMWKYGTYDTPRIKGPITINFPLRRMTPEEMAEPRNVALFDAIQRSMAAHNAMLDEHASELWQTPQGQR